MAQLPYKSGGLLIPFNPELHLFCILNDPCASRLCLVTMITTIYDGRHHDPACVIDVGDHPFIRHPSYLLYRAADTLRASQIVSLIDQKYYIPREDFEAAVFKRIRDGLFASDETKRWAINYARDLRI